MKILKSLAILASTLILNSTAFANTSYTFDKKIPSELTWASAYMYHHDSQKYCSRKPTIVEIFQISDELIGDQIKASRFFSAMDYNPRDNHISLKEIEGFVKENCTR